MTTQANSGGTGVTTPMCNESTHAAKAASRSRQDKGRFHRSRRWGALFSERRLRSWSTLRRLGISYAHALEHAFLLSLLLEVANEGH